MAKTLVTHVCKIGKTIDELASEFKAMQRKYGKIGRVGYGPRTSRRTILIDQFAMSFASRGIWANSEESSKKLCKLLGGKFRKIVRDRREGELGCRFTFKTVHDAYWFCDAIQKKIDRTLVSLVEGTSVFI